MTESSFPWTTNGVGDGNAYSADFFTSMYEDIFNQFKSSRADASVIYDTGNGVDPALDVQETSPQSANVEVKSGSAIVNGKYYNSSTDETLPISANNDASGFDRIDTVVLEIDYVSQTVRLNVVTGTPSASPVAPTLTKTAVLYQVPIANVTAQNLFTVITNADIDNTVKEAAILWESEQGGTGIEGGYIAGDLIVSSGTNTLEILTDGGDYRYPIGNTSVGTQYVFGSQRASYVRYINSVTSDPVVSPVPINDSDDSEGNFRATISSNRFYPKARKLKISGALTYMNSNTTRFDNYLYLYDVNAAANITDIDGNLVRTQTSITNVNLADKTFIWQDQIVDFDGTEDVEIRIANTFVGFFASLTNASLVHFLSLRRVG